MSAIRAPTPISSLVHSSTLVVAGVFILIQYRYCFYDQLETLKYIRLCRLLIRTFGLLNEIDIKKLIAYSTIRHVSLMMYIYSFKLFKVVYFHLNIHAMFKSLIFICFGFVILVSFHRQDKRLVSLVNLNPIIKIVFYFSCLCLAGLPFLSAFFSKDLIIEKLIELNTEILYVLILLVFLGVRVFYSLKLIRVYNTIYSLRLLEKNYLGITRVLIIIVVRVIIVNVYLSVVFRLSLEIISRKFIIYLLVLVFFVLRFVTKLNYKAMSYDKLKNFKEV